MLYVINKKRGNKQKKGTVLILGSESLFNRNIGDLEDCKHEFYLVYVEDDNIDLDIGDSIVDVGDSWEELYIEDKKYELKLVGECFVHRRDNYNSFFIDDTKSIMNDIKGEKNFNRYVYYELTGLYVYPEFRNQLFGTYFVKNICEYINEYNNGLTHKDPVIIADACALMKEYPEMPTEEEFEIIINKVSKFYESCGFISTNDYNDFDYSNGMIYVNDVTAIPIINFYKKLYNDQRNSNLNSN